MADGQQEVIEDNHKCEECLPGLPGWMATFSDMVTLLLTFFVLLLSFAKTETAKYEAALGSIRNAFGGNVLKHGEVIRRGKSPDDSPSMMESDTTVLPFPIDFLTTEGILDKKEINRESEEDLRRMREDLKDYNLSDSANIYEMPEGIKVTIKDKVYFKESSLGPIDSGVIVPIYQRLVNMMKDRGWIVIVEGHASAGEVYTDASGVEHDAFSLSSLRSQAVARSLMARGVPPGKVTSVFYGDSRPQIISASGEVNNEKSRRVEFIVRKRDLGAAGRKVPSGG